jgi:hypothetical protein
LPPALLTTANGTIARCSCWNIFWIVRAMASVLPPGDDGEIISTALDGRQSCALTCASCAINPAAHKTQQAIRQTRLNAIEKFTVNLRQYAAVPVRHQFFIGIDAQFHCHVLFRQVCTMHTQGEQRVGRQPVGGAQYIEYFGAVEVQRFAGCPRELPIRFERCMCSKLSATTARTPSRAGPFAAQSRDEPAPYSRPAITISGTPRLR